MYKCFKTSKLFALFITLSLFNCIKALAQADCDAVKTGIFYYYPKNSSDKFLEMRDDKYLHEINLDKGDSAVYEIKWTDDCVYSLKYVSGNAVVSDEVAEFNKKHKLLFEINKITRDYYIFTGYVDKTSNQPILKDTMWLNIKANITSNLLFQPVKSPTEIKKAHFSDTSKYAILYLYRPGKLTNSLGSYLVYFDDEVMCVAKNNSGYIFKILKEGNFNIKSRLYKDEASAGIDIKFGNKYYVKSSVLWGFHNFNNYKLKMGIMKPEDGENEFYDVNLQ